MSDNLWDDLNLSKDLGTLKNKSQKSQKPKSF